MTAVNCPMCELRFATKNERDWHLDHEHHPVHAHAPTTRPLVWPRPTEDTADSVGAADPDRP